MGVIESIESDVSAVVGDVKSLFDDAKKLSIDTLSLYEGDLLPGEAQDIIDNLEVGLAAMTATPVKAGTRATSIAREILQDAIALLPRVPTATVITNADGSTSFQSNSPRAQRHSATTASTTTVTTTVTPIVGGAPVVSNPVISAPVVPLTPATTTTTTSPTIGTTLPATP